MTSLRRRPHWKEVVQDWVADPPYTTRKCAHCSYNNRYDTADWVAARCAGCGVKMDAPWLITDSEARRAELAAARDSERGVVYYVRLSNLVKIGFTSNLRSRMQALPFDELLGVEPGDYSLEARRHKQFAGLLHTGREWFSASDELLKHAAAMRAEHGEPYAVASEIESEHRRLWELRNHGGSDRLEAEVNSLIEEMEAKAGVLAAT